MAAPPDSMNAYKLLLEGYIGYALRIESGTHQVLGDYKITGVDATNKDRWILECRPSAYTATTTTVNNIVWSLHEGLPVEIIRCATAQYRYISSKHYIYPNTNYTVTADDKNRYIQITGGPSWDLFPLRIIEVDVNNNRWEVERDVGTDNSNRNSGQIVVYGDDKARDATGKIYVSLGRVISVSVEDEGKFLTYVPPGTTNNNFEVTTPGFTTAGTTAQFRARLKVSGLYIHAGGSGYTSAPQVYALYTGNNGPRALQGGAGPLTGRYEYACTYRYKDSSGKILYESGLSESFWSVNLASNKAAHIQGLGRGSIWTSGMWANDNDYELRPFPTHLVIYRRGGNVGVFREAMEVPWETVNSARVYVDNRPDAELGAICQTIGTMPPPSGTRYVQHHARRMWYAAGDSLYASKQDEPWVCSNDSNPTLMTAPIKFTPEKGADITGLVSVDRVLIVFTINAAYRIDGTTAQDFRLTKIEASGCNLHGSAREFRGGVIWHSQRGVEYWRNGYGVEYVGEAIGPLWSSPALSYTGLSTVFTHNGVEMYAIRAPGETYLRVFSGSGWSRVRPPDGVVRSLSGYTGGLRVATAYETIDGTEYKVYEWPHTARTGWGMITWPMNDFGSAMHVKSVVNVRALYSGETGSPHALTCTISFRNPTEVFPGQAVIPTPKTYGNHVLHQRLRGVHGYELQPVLDLGHINTNARVHGLELDVVQRGLAR